MPRYVKKYKKRSTKTLASLRRKVNKLDMAMERKHAYLQNYSSAATLHSPDSATATYQYSPFYSMDQDDGNMNNFDGDQIAAHTVEFKTQVNFTAAAMAAFTYAHSCPLRIMCVKILTTQNFTWTATALGKYILQNNASYLSDAIFTYPNTNATRPFTRGKDFVILYDKVINGLNSQTKPNMVIKKKFYFKTPLLIKQLNNDSQQTLTNDIVFIIWVPTEFDGLVEARGVRHSTYTDN